MEETVLKPVTKHISFFYHYLNCINLYVYYLLFHEGRESLAVFPLL